jgi:dTDP-4-dehydrorhamnose reductase
MKTVLVTGSNGLLGQKITSKIIKEGGVNLIATSKGANRFLTTEGYTYLEMDILDPNQVAAVIEDVKPDAIIHTAAMTNVDTCHIKRELAHQLNVEATQTLVDCCENKGIHFIYISTDFVFDGVNGPYDEEAVPKPVSYYGETKLEAEEIVKKITGKWAILRTILVYGIVNDLSRSNIVLWAKGALTKGEPLNAVNDQWRMPTLAEDLADACISCVTYEAQGVYHISGKDMMTVAELVERVADFWKLDRSLINEISSLALNQDAKRPVKTGFILDKAMTELNYQPHSFEEGLGIVREQLERR